MSERTPDQTPEAWSDGAAGYEACFAPFTGPYADDAVRLLGIDATDRVLDVAAGSGALSLRAGRAGAEVLATDFAPGMVDLLAGRFVEAGLDRCSTEVMDGQALTLPDGGFDVAASMFGVIFFPEIDRGLAELARVVRPGGRVGVATWRLEGFRMSGLVGEALRRTIPGFEAPTTEPPWARLGDADGLEAALAATGLVDVEVHVLTHTWRWDDPEDYFRHLPDWSPPVKPLFDLLDGATVDAAAGAFADVIAEMAQTDEGLASDALLGIGRRP